MFNTAPSGTAPSSPADAKGRECEPAAPALEVQPDD